jgi:hypothetical protein
LSLRQWTMWSLDVPYVLGLFYYELHNSGKTVIYLFSFAVTGFNIYVEI